MASSSWACPFPRPKAAASSGDKGMEVLLVSEELPEEKDNATATYLSQRTQSGSGNTQERRPARLPSQAQPGGPRSPRRRQPIRRTSCWPATAAGSQTAIQIQSLRGNPRACPQPRRQRPEAQRSGDEELVLRGITRDELYVSADTRASRLAPYLDAWRRRIERIGTLNYPSVGAATRHDGQPGHRGDAAAGRQTAAARRSSAPAAIRKSMRRRSISCGWPARSTPSRPIWRATTARCASPTNGSSKAGASQLP